MNGGEGLFYDPKGFTCTEPVDFNEYFSPFSKAVESELKARVNQLSENLQQEVLFDGIGIELTEKDRINLAEICDPDNLSFDEEIPPVLVNDSFSQPVHVTYDIPPCADHLKIIECKKKWMNKFGKVQPYPIPKCEKTKHEDQDLNPYSDVMFIVKDYHPFKYTQDSSYFRKERIKCNFEIAILGSQTLADLRDKLLCPNDLGYTLELNSPAEMTTPQVRQEYPSGFMFIENCFYNDMRDENAIDYSEPIRQWGEARDLGKWTTGLMDKTKLIDLKVRLGYPYVYQHQGDCEHLITFAEARLLRETDPLDSKQYPYIQLETRYTSNICYICGLQISKFVVTDADRLPHKHSYFCKDCVISYNYIDGKKVGSFKLYPFYDKSCVLLS